jgi:glucose/arabinose dehydrogenase
MRGSTKAIAASLAVALAVAAFVARAMAPYPIGFGPNPDLPQPHHSLIPTVKIAGAVGWPAGGAPTPAPGFQVTAIARGLPHPRWLYVLPNNDVLVAETDGPATKPNGIRGWIEGLVMSSAGAEKGSPNRIDLLRGGARSVFLTGLTSPFGMTLVGNDLYVADTNEVLRYHYEVGQTHLIGAPKKVMDLPAFPIDHHWTKNIVASPDGSKLYVTIGSNSNVGENGMAAEGGRARILVIDRATGAWRDFATGLRNPNGMDFQPQTGALWTVVNERDELGDNLVPDYLTSVKDGGFYGWPYSYYGQHVDTRVSPQRPDLVAKAIAPDYALGGHTASLGLVFDRGPLFPDRYKNGAFIGQHGSWNRSVYAGYKVIFVPFSGGKPNGPPQDVLTGFLNKDGKAQGRPVGVVVDKTGALLVADDVGGVVWRVTPTR